MAKSEWKVFSNIFNGVKKYRVGRQLRENEPLHSGNIEYLGGYLDDVDHAEYIATRANEGCPILIDGKCNPECAILKGNCPMPCLYKR